MGKDLFMMVMEADGDLLQPFDSGAPDEGGPEPTDQPPQGNDNTGFDEPPPLAEDGDLLSDTGDLDSGGSEESLDGEQKNEDENKEDMKLSEKANNILNQKLYQQMLNRNNDIEEIINNLQTIVPTLPYDIVQSNDQPLNNLKSALLRGQKYVINDFVDTGYGENLLFFQKLDSLYTLLLNQIDTNLKKVKNN